MSFMQFMETMGTSSIPIVAAFFIGLMTAFSPCPLATNITAIAYAAKDITNKKKTILIGFLYTLGRMITYVAIAALIIWIGINTQKISFSLQKYGEKILGPLLLVIGLIMLEIIKFPVSKKNKHIESLKEYFASKGEAGSFFLGIIFALAFCPFSAVLYFGMLIPLALRVGDPIILPAVFAFATGLPVIVLSILLAYSMSAMGKAMHKIKVFEKIMRKIVALVFLVVGVYYIIKLFY